MELNIRTNGKVNLVLISEQDKLTVEISLQVLFKGYLHNLTFNILVFQLYQVPYAKLALVVL
jgi:hypothetical protein